MRKLYLLLIALMALSLTSVASAEEHDDDSVMIDLAEQNDSGISGSATLTENEDGTTTVMLELEGTPEGGSHPAHIHAGRCPEPGAIVYPLENVDGDTGMSETTIEADLATIMSAEHAINIHLSKEEIATYVACGDLPTMAEAPATGGGASSDTSLPLMGLGLVAAALAAGSVLVTRARSV